MKKASKIVPYEQDYLSLLCRRNELKAKKIGNKWYTTIDWLNNYLEEKKPDFLIETDGLEKNKWKKIFLIMMIFIFLLFLSYFFLIKPNLAEKEINEEEFPTEEILKIPNDDGGYDIYHKKSNKN